MKQDVVARLETLAHLYASGAISDDEYRDQKAEVIASDGRSPRSGAQEHTGKADSSKSVWSIPLSKPPWNAAEPEATALDNDTRVGRWSLPLSKPPWQRDGSTKRTGPSELSSKGLLNEAEPGRWTTPLTRTPWEAEAPPRSAAEETLLRRWLSPFLTPPWEARRQNRQRLTALRDTGVLTAEEYDQAVQASRQDRSWTRTSQVLAGACFLVAVILVGAAMVASSRQSRQDQTSSFFETRMGVEGDQSGVPQQSDRTFGQGSGSVVPTTTVLPPTTVPGSNPLDPMPNAYIDLELIAGAGWRSGGPQRIDARCDLLADIGPSQVQRISNPQLDIGVYLAPTSEATSGAWVPDAAVCFDAEVSEIAPPPVRDTLASAMLHQEESSYPLLALYSFADESDQEWVIGVSGGLDDLELQAEGTIGILRSALAQSAGDGVRSEG